MTDGQLTSSNLQDEISQRQRVEAELQELGAQLRDLSLRSLRDQENERSRLAYELHDDIGQDLTILKLNLQASLKALEKISIDFPQSIDAQKLRTKLHSSYDLSNKLMERVRTLSLDLRPTMLDNLGLAPALRWYLGRVTESSNLAIQFHVPDNFVRPTTDIETVFFRIAQEAITNILRHAQAKNMWLQLAQRDQQVEMHITDDGVGFDYSGLRDFSETLGLSGMARRALLIDAQLEIDTAPGKGTRIGVSARLD